ncbi:MAG: hypothetical protein IH991_22645 [Planctomycetes bacterium]|nr:hypothetical protein [Planctomycetota bacterium]
MSVANLKIGSNKKGFGKHVQEMITAINNFKHGLEKRLNERAEKEAKDITAILTELKKAIEAELNDPQYVQALTDKLLELYPLLTSSLAQ